MKKLYLFVLISLAITMLSGCGSGTFTIKDDNFQATDVCDGTGTMEIFIENGTVQAKAQGDIQTKMLKNGFPSVWCHGLTHLFVGTVKVSGYTFESDASDPLKFTVDRNKGFYYTSGKGTVTAPDGKVTSLP
ncbi:MAG: hypothetical protein WBC70_16060 [Candidatus Aminicenantales bacterium]